MTVGHSGTKEFIVSEIRISNTDEMISLSHLNWFLNPTEDLAEGTVKFQLYTNRFSPVRLCFSKLNGDWSLAEGAVAMELARHGDMILGGVGASPSPREPLRQVEGVVWHEPYFIFL